MLIYVKRLIIHVSRLISGNVEVDAVSSLAELFPLSSFSFVRNHHRLLHLCLLGLAELSEAVKFFESLDVHVLKADLTD